MRLIATKTITDVMKAEAVGIGTGVGIPMLTYSILGALPISDFRGGPFQDGLMGRKGEAEIKH